MNYLTFITEAVSDESKLTHLEHLEDHVMNAGKKGYAHAFHNLEDVHGLLKGKHNKTSVSVKYDGSPSIVFGHHPETGKFFVSTKSIFNKDPKINYTNEDIEKNHGHAPGLVAKLREALVHLKKTAPKQGVYQGDLMYSKHEVEDKGNKYHFKPNTITYSTPKNSEEGKKIEKAKIGVAVHTSYKGKTLESMKANYNMNPKEEGFKEHDDVHMLPIHQNFKKTKFTPEQEDEYKKHIGAATKEFNKAPDEAFDAGQHHADHLKTYINATVKDGSTPTHQGFKEHVKNKMVKEVGKMKSAKGIEQKTQAMNQHLSSIDQDKSHISSVLKMHHHLQKAKDVLTHAMADSPTYEHSIAGQKTKPEGFVAVRGGRPTKFVDRAEFSRANFLSRER
jgi:hypothetical protein